MGLKSSSRSLDEVSLFFFFDSIYRDKSFPLNPTSYTVTGSIRGPADKSADLARLMPVQLIMQGAQIFLKPYLSGVRISPARRGFKATYGGLLPSIKWRLV